MRHAALQCGYCTRRPPADAQEPARCRRAAHRGGHPSRPRRQYLPLHRLPLDPRSGPRSGGMTTLERQQLRRGRRLAPAQGRCREAARQGPVRRRHGDGGDAPRQGPAQPPPARADPLDRHLIAALARWRASWRSSPPPTSTTSSPITATRSRIARSSRSTACASRASRWPPSPPSTRRRRRRPCGDRGRVRAASRARHGRARPWPTMLPKLHQRHPKVGLFHGLGELGERAGQRLLPPSPRVRRHQAPPRPTRRSWSRATYTFPAVYQYAMETHATIAHHHGDGITLWANCQHPFLVQAEIADLFGLRDRLRADRRALPRRRLRLEVLHEDGAADRRARAQGRPAGADRQPRRGVDGHLAPPRHALLDAHERRAPTARCSTREVSASGWTPAPTPTTARA